MSDPKLPVSYWLARAILLIAIFGVAYLLWSSLVVHWLNTADGWIAEFEDWTDQANPL